MLEYCEGKARRYAGVCDRKPTIVRDGKRYCWQHDPERLRRIATERRAYRQKETAKVEADHDARVVRKKLETAAGVNDLTDAELAALAAAGGVRKLLAVLRRTRAGGGDGSTEFISE